MKDTNNIRERMEVVGSCGNQLGTVDRVEANSIKLTKNDPKAGGEHHWIPLDWVESVDDQVHLNRDCDEAEQGWQSAPINSAV